MTRRATLWPRFQRRPRTEHQRSRDDLAAQTVASFPAGRFLRARAELDDAAGNVLQTVTSAPVLVYDADDPNLALMTYSDVRPPPARRAYYSIPAARALPGTVELRLSASPVTSANATATVTPPSGVAPRLSRCSRTRGR